MLMPPATTREEIWRQAADLQVRADRLQSSVYDINLIDQIDRAHLEIAEAEAWAARPEFEHRESLVTLAAATLLLAAVRLDVVEDGSSQVPPFEGS